MNKISSNQLVGVAAPLRTKSGYEFYPADDVWRLDKNSRVAIDSVRDLLDREAAEGYVKTLTYYAQNFSGGHVVSSHYRFLHFLRSTKASAVTEPNLINYRASLSLKNEWYLGTIRGLLRRWHRSGYVILPCINGQSVKR